MSDLRDEYTISPEGPVLHTPCGLPVELCACPDARVKYDWERDVFVDTHKLPEEPDL